MSDFVRRPATDRATGCTAEQYRELYQRSIDDPDGFWLEQARRLDWSTAPTLGGEWSYDPVAIRWFADGALNLCYNAVDRHLAERGDATALIFEPDDPGAPGRTLTYRELHTEVVRHEIDERAVFANEADDLRHLLLTLERKVLRPALQCIGEGQKES